MRVDGRRTDELRPLHFETHFSAFAEGSVLISQGRTKVLCTATIQEGVPRWMQNQDRSGGWVTAEYAMLPRATQERTPRENFGLSGRTQEIRRLISRSLRAAVDLEALGTITCIVDCDVLQADGGTRTAAINGGYIALALALGRMIRQGVIARQVLRAPIAAVSVGIVDGEALLDLCYEEDHRAHVDATVVRSANGEFVEVQFSAEHGSFSREDMDRMLQLAEQGITEIIEAQTQALQAPQSA